MYPEIPKNEPYAQAYLSTTPIMQGGASEARPCIMAMGCQQCLPLSVVQLKVKHC